MKIARIVDTAVLAGEIMLCNGAETYRVEETIQYILNTGKAEQIDAFVIPTGIMVSVKPQDGEIITVIRRVKERQNNLRKVVAANEISRRLCEGDLTTEDAYEELKKAEQYESSRAFYNLCLVVVAGSFALLSGGGLAEVLAAALNGVLLALVALLSGRVRMNTFYQDVLSAIMITVGAVLCKEIFPVMLDTDIVIISSIMPLVPGVAITNAIRDTLQKDYIAGTARAMEAFLKAASIAIGVAVGLALSGALTGGAVV